ANAGMKVPSLNRMPTQSPPAGHSAGVAFVSGPRTVRKVFPSSRVTAISKWLAATERKSPAAPLSLRHTRSTNGESDCRAKNLSNMIENSLTRPETRLAASRAARRRRLDLRQPSIHEQFGAGNVAALIRGQEHDDGRDFIGGAESPERNHGGQHRG